MGSPGRRSVRSTVDAGQVEAWLAPHLASQDLPLDSRILERLAAFANELDAWNQRINLTGARDAAAIVCEHVVDALAALPHLPSGAFSLLDVGSGGGLPGIPLAILRPDAEVLLLEPITKKATFLRAMRRELPLENVEVVIGRLEELDPSARFDRLISRAVWDPATWLERARPWRAPGGRILALAGADAGEPPAGVEVHPYRIGHSSRAIWVD